MAAKRRRQYRVQWRAAPPVSPSADSPSLYVQAAVLPCLQRRHDRALRKIGASRMPLVTSEPVVLRECLLRLPGGSSHRCFERPGKGSSMNQFTEYPSDELNGGRQYWLRDWLRRPETRQGYES